MHTDILSPKDLFQKDVRYTIPPFQRPYVWTQDDQWEPLWEDVRSVAENYLDELERSGNDVIEAEERTGPHFLGAVVVKQVPTAARDIDQREVIDGQQRVTTLQLLLDAIQHVYESSKDQYVRTASRSADENPCYEESSCQRGPGCQCVRSGPTDGSVIPPNF